MAWRLFCLIECPVRWNRWLSSPELQSSRRMRLGSTRRWSARRQRKGRRRKASAVVWLGLVHRQESVAGLGALLALYRRIRHAALCAIDDKALLPPARSERSVRTPHGWGSGRTPGIEPMGHPFGRHGRQVPLPKAPRHPATSLYIWKILDDG